MVTISDFDEISTEDPNPRETEKPENFIFIKLIVHKLWPLEIYLDIYVACQQHDLPFHNFTS